MKSFLLTLASVFLNYVRLSVPFPSPRLGVLLRRENRDNVVKIKVVVLCGKLFGYVIVTCSTRSSILCHLSLSKSCSTPPTQIPCFVVVFLDSPSWTSTASGSTLKRSGAGSYAANYYSVDRNHPIQLNAALKVFSRTPTRQSVPWWWRQERSSRLIKSIPVIRYQCWNCTSSEFWVEKPELAQDLGHSYFGR